MTEIPGSLVIFRPTQPFLNWLNELPDAGEPEDLMTVREDPSAYLIPDYDSTEDGMAFVQSNATAFFDHLLLEWCTNEKWWPVIRNFAMFRAWFDIELLSTLFNARQPSQPFSWN